MNLLHVFFKKIESTSILYLTTILIGATFLVYINTLANGLFFDDEDFIYKNQYIANFDIVHFFTQNLIAGAGKVSNYYRPVLMINFGVEHALFGNAGFIYHLDSMILQAAVVALVFLLLYKLFADKILACAAAFLFAIHPIQTEAIAYASGQGDPLSAFFLLLAILLSFSKKTKWRIVSLCCLVAALLSKETTLVAPGLFFLCHFIYSSRESPSREVTKKNSRQTRLRLIITQSFLKTLPYGIITGIYFVLRLTVLNFSDTLNFYGAKNIYTGSLFVRLNTFLNLIPKYLGLLFYPHTLFIERPAYVFPMITITTGLVIVGIIALLFLAWRLFWQFPIILFSVLWFFVAFIPASGIIPINGIFYEHFAYVPSIGFFTLLSFVIIQFFKPGLYSLSFWGGLKGARLLDKGGKRVRVREKTAQIVQTTISIILFIFFIAYFSWFAVRTIQRNAEWHDPIGFYTQTLSHNQSSRLYNNLAMAYSDENDAPHAITTYKKAITFGDYYPQTHYNLANQYAAINNLHNAEIEYKNALKLDPGFYLAYIKLFEIYKNANNTHGITWVLTHVKNLAAQNKNFLPLYNQLNQAK